MVKEKSFYPDVNPSQAGLLTVIAKFHFATWSFKSIMSIEWKNELTIVAFY